MELHGDQRLRDRRCGANANGIVEGDECDVAARKSAVTHPHVCADTTAAGGKAWIGLDRKDHIHRGAELDVVLSIA